MNRAASRSHRFTLLILFYLSVVAGPAWVSGNAGDGDFKAAGSTSSTRISLPHLLTELVPPLMAKHKVPGVSIVGIEDRRIAWERHFGVRCAGKSQSVDDQTVFEAAFMSKLPAACVALKLVEQGKLDLDRPLSNYLGQPYLTNEPLHLKITARMVLSHTTGFPSWRKGGPLLVSTRDPSRSRKLKKPLCSMFPLRGN